MNDNELARQICEANGFSGVYLTDFAYPTAIIGFSHDERIVYSHRKMVDYLVETQEMTPDEAVEWIEYNTIDACLGEDAPIIVFDREDI